MGINFSNDTPIYLQIIEHIKTQIISGAYLPGQKIPSVRDLSLEYQVNPNTIQKALAELENVGLIFTERTSGKFVTGDAGLIKKIRMETIQKMVDQFCLSMKKVGISEDELINILKERKSK